MFTQSLPKLSPVRDADWTRPEDAVHYCGSGVSACHNLLAMELAGMPGGKLYVGSWSEWSADPARPREPSKGERHG